MRALSNNGSDAQNLDNLIADAMAELSDAKVRLEVQADQLQAELNLVKAEILKVNRIMRAAQPPKSAPRRKPSVTARGGRTPAFLERAERVRQLIASAPEGMTSPEITQALGIDKTSTDRSLRELRREEKIRHAGYRKVEAGRQPIVWKVMANA